MSRAVRVCLPGLSFHERRKLSVPDQHMLKIARKTMNLSCIGLRVVGGPDHYQAASIIHRLTGVFVCIDAGCMCKRHFIESALSER